MSRLSGRMCHCLFCNAEILDHLVLVTRIKVSFLFFFFLSEIISKPTDLAAWVAEPRACMEVY